MKKLITLLLLALSMNSYGSLSEQDRSFNVVRNFLSDPGFEAGIGQSGTGTTYSWKASGGSLIALGSSGNRFEGSRVASWDSSAASQTLQSNLTSFVSDGPANKTIAASCYFRVDTGTATHKLQIMGGASVLNEVTINNSSTSFTQTSLSAPAPSGTSSISLRIISVASNEPAILIDKCFLGLSEGFNSAQVSQAKYYGSITYPATASCSWDISQATFASDYSADSDCTTPVGTNVKGLAAAPSTKIPAIQLDNAPAGTYFFVGRGQFIKNNNTANDSAFFRFSDGTNVTDVQAVTVGTTASAVSAPMISGTITYTTSGSRTVKVQGRSATAVIASVNAVANDFTIDVFYYPASADLVTRADTTNWQVDANISGANPSLGTVNVSSFTGIENASLTLTNNAGSGNISAMIPCSSTNPPTGTTCAAGNESVGASFTLPAVQDVEACIAFGSNIVTGAGGGLELNYQLVETANNSQTILQEGKDRAFSGLLTASTNVSVPYRVCGTFTFTSAGQKTIRLMYEQNVVSGTISAVAIGADASGAVGQRDIHITIRPRIQQVPAFVFVNSVTSNSTGVERIERAKIFCSGSSSITSQSGTWITAVGNRSSGACAVTIATGIFSSSPTCFITNSNAASAATLTESLVNVSSATAVSIGGQVLTSGSSTIALVTSSNYELLCMGPR